MLQSGSHSQPGQRGGTNPPAATRIAVPKAAALLVSLAFSLASFWLALCSESPESVSPSAPDPSKETVHGSKRSPADNFGKEARRPGHTTEQRECNAW